MAGQSAAVAGAHRLVHRGWRRHHTAMVSVHALTLIKLAEHLRDDEIHVWRLDYQVRLGRAPLCSVLAAYLGTDPNSVRLIDGEHGRPALALPHDQSLGFNWSHTGGQAVIAVGRHLTPGIDVERRRPRPRALQIAQRYFSQDESAALARLPETEREHAFLRVWTAKEAVVKALGRGLAFGLDRLSIDCSDRELVLQRLDGDDAAAWQLHALPFGPDLTAALAWRGEARTIRVGRLPAALDRRTVSNPP